MTGLAVCDPSETIVSPLAGIPTAKDLPVEIVELVRSEDVEAIVLGLPLNMDGSSGSQSKIVRDFADKLKILIDIPIFFQDERLTTFAAEEKLSQQPFGGLASRKLTRKKKRARIDALAAAEILQAFLDSKKTT
jgi:putative holliday junction resolvase